MSGKLLALCLLLSTGAWALHEDEVGQRDWNRQHIGIATTAAFHFTQQTKQVYIGSEQGAFGAIGTGKPEIRWRHVFSPDETVVCWAPHGDVVVAITSKGNVISALPATGDVVQTRHLSTHVGAATIKVHACAASVEKGVTALITTDEEQLNTEIVSVKRDDSFMSLGKVTLADGIKKASMDANAGHIYAVLKNGELAYSAGSANALKALAGKVVAGCTPLAIDAASGNVIVRIKGGDQVILSSAGVESALPSCETGKKHCKYAFVDGKAVRVSREDDATIRVSLGAFEASVPVAGPWAPTILAAQVVEGKQSKKLYLLVKDCHSNLNMVVVTEGAPTGAVQWTRLEGMSSPVFIKIADHDMAGVPNPADWAGTDHTVFVLGSSGMLYKTFTLPSRAAETVVFADVAAAIAKAAGVGCLHGKVTYKRMSVDSGSIIVVAQLGTEAYVVDVKASTGAITATNKFADVENFLGHMIVGANKKVFVHEHETDIPTSGTYGVDLHDIASNVIRGVRVNSNNVVENSWSMTFAGKIVGHATAASHLAVYASEHLRVFANETSKVSEIRRKYPTANLLAVAHIEMVDVDADGSETSVLVVSFIDMVTGSVLATNRHVDAAGPVHMLVAEHAVITHFFNTERHKYLVDVSEFFEAEDSFANEASMASPASVVSSFFIKPRTVSSFSMRPPHVASQVLVFPPGAITSLGVTVSFQGVARKMVIFGATSGHVYAIDLRSFLFGGQKHPMKQDALPFTFVPTPSQTIISHRIPVQQSRLVVVSPTSLESSNHVIVAGLDMMYARVSAGKAWDLLNDDFNSSLLLVIVGVLLLATLVARWFAARKRLSIQWS